MAGSIANGKSELARLGGGRSTIVDVTRSRTFEMGLPRISTPSPTASGRGGSGGRGLFNSMSARNLPTQSPGSNRTPGSSGSGREWRVATSRSDVGFNREQSRQAPSEASSRWEVRKTARLSQRSARAAAASARGHVRSTRKHERSARAHKFDGQDSYINPMAAKSPTLQDKVHRRV
jgi:hypothetical protein